MTGEYTTVGANALVSQQSQNCYHPWPYNPPWSWPYNPPQQVITYPANTYVIHHNTIIDQDKEKLREIIREEIKATLLEIKEGSGDGGTVQTAVDNAEPRPLEMVIQSNHEIPEEVKQMFPGLQILQRSLFYVIYSCEMLRSLTPKERETLDQYVYDDDLVEYYCPDL